MSKRITSFLVHFLDSLGENRQKKRKLKKYERITDDGSQLSFIYMNQLFGASLVELVPHLFFLSLPHFYRVSISNPLRLLASHVFWLRRKRFWKDFVVEDVDGTLR